MFSISTLNDFVNGVEFYSVAGRKLFARRNALRVFLPDLWNLAVGDSSHAMFVASANQLRMLFHPMAPLLSHVLQIVFVCSLPKMLWIATYFIITGVAHGKYWADLPVCKKKGNAMCAKNIFPYAVLAISVVCASRPNPAVSIRPMTWGFINLAPKSFLFLRGQRWNVTISLSHDVLSFVKNFVVRAEQVLAHLPARFAL